VLLFQRKKELEVQGFILKVVNNNCPELKALIEGPRLDRRVNLTVVVLVVPMEKKDLAMGRAFTTVTKEFSTTGLSLVLDETKPLDEVVLGFRWEGEMVFVQATAKHLSPIGGGFYQLGFKMNRMVHVDEYRELASMSF